MIVFQLYDHAVSLITTFPNSSTIDTITGIFEKGEKYKNRASATKAKGRFDFNMEYYHLLPPAHDFEYGSFKYNKNQKSPLQNPQLQGYCS